MGGMTLEEYILEYVRTKFENILDLLSCFNFHAQGEQPCWTGGMEINHHLVYEFVRFLIDCRGWICEKRLATCDLKPLLVNHVTAVIQLKAK